MLAELWWWFGASRRALEDLRDDADRMRWSEEHSIERECAHGVLWALAVLEREATGASRLVSGKGSEAIKPAAPPWHAWDELIGAERRYLLIPIANDREREGQRREILERACVPPLTRVRVDAAVQRLSEAVDAWAATSDGEVALNVHGREAPLVMGRDEYVAIELAIAHSALHGTFLDHPSTVARVRATLRDDMKRTRAGQVDAHERRKALAALLEIGEGRIDRAMRSRHAALLRMESGAGRPIRETPSR